MRRALFGMPCTLLIVLAACSGTPEPPTATLVAATVTSAPAGTPLAIDQIAQTIAIPPPGQIGYVDDSLTPPPLTPIVFTFDQVQLELVDSANSTNTVIDVFEDGQVVINGENRSGNSAAIATLTTLLDAIRFYDLQGIFTSDSGAARGYRYYLTVTGPLGSRSISADDGFVPPELQAIFTAILTIADTATGEASPAP